ncbi:cation:proton antiporter [Vibrio astriarenae]|uniref:Cation:proton antiporter n=1 Tax=Vibrio agarivorans TaxID=153622 RepID=A0ABT7Y114_9VIBR|nr:cation:proton antiporter family protein [Vibrio agarivorans]MDN2481738.1 cation:proton antiporter [Vibrio agarivorans]MDN3661290.1 cation:proton antiporter [Vibrio agarivorans]
MDIILISAAFVAGVIALKCHLPPLVGFLLAGFALHSFGYQSNPLIDNLADLGVTLLLFTIGLKLDIRTLFAKEIWAGATAHNLFSTLFFTVALGFLKLLGLPALAQLETAHLLLLGFALSFSSTVFAVKALQEKGEMNATYGNLAIGILIMQDIFAVLFLTISTGKIPEWYAIALFALPLLRPIFFKLLDIVGHGEMLVLMGIFLALVCGAGLFEAVGMKADLGALILGMLLAGHYKASELSKALFNLKELFLICFFLNIGLSAEPTWQGLGLAVLFMLLLPIKGLLYFLIINHFKFRVRTSLFASLALFNFSEFGLIVGGLAFKLGWMSGDMLVAIALAVSLSFIVAAPINNNAHAIYQRLGRWLKEHAAEKLNHRDQLIDPGNAQVIILGMGRIGSGAYDELYQRYGSRIMGVEVREDAANAHRAEGRNVIAGDATDSDFWERILDTAHVKLILLAMPNHQGNQTALYQLQRKNYQGQIAAIAAYPDQIDGLLADGVDAAFNIYNEAGSGFARHVCEQLKPDFDPTTRH